MLKVSDGLIEAVRLAVANYHFGPLVRKPRYSERRAAGRVRRNIEIGFRLAFNVQQSNALSWAPPYEPDEYRALRYVSEIEQSEAYGEMSAVDCGFLEAYGDWFRLFVLLDYAGCVLSVSDDMRRIKTTAFNLGEAERIKMRHRNEYGAVVSKFRTLANMPDKAKVPLGVVTDWAQDFGEPTEEEITILHAARDERADL